MSLARQLITSSSALILTVGTAMALDRSQPCIPEGSTQDVPFDRPPLEGPNDPTSAEWIGPNGEGSPDAFEADPISPDDPMGPATPGTPPDTASVPIENKGGHLSGPNGAVQNGTGEGDCIEVYVRWTYRYKAKVTRCDTSGGKIEGPGGWGGSPNCYEVEVWKYAYKRSEEKDVCPC